MIETITFLVVFLGVFLITSLFGWYIGQAITWLTRAARGEKTEK